MKTLVTVLVTLVVVAALGTIVYFTKPTWLGFSPQLGPDGFPKSPKEGDKFVKNNTVYTYTNGQWIVTEAGSGGGGPVDEQRIVLTYPDWTNVVVYENVPRLGRICFRKTPGATCPDRIRVNVSGNWVVYQFVSESGTLCCYQKQ